MAFERNFGCLCEIEIVYDLIGLFLVELLFTSHQHILFPLPDILVDSFLSVLALLEKFIISKSTAKDGHERVPNSTDLVDDIVNKGFENIWRC